MGYSVTCPVTGGVSPWSNALPGGIREEGLRARPIGARESLRHAGQCSAAITRGENVSMTGQDTSMLALVKTFQH